MMNLSIFFSHNIYFVPLVNETADKELGAA